MPSVRLQSVSFSFGEVSVFDEVSLHLPPGWTGVVGPNGSGKSTLLQLINQALGPTAGAVVHDPRDAVVRWCAQRVETLDDDVRALAEDVTAGKLRSRLALEVEALTRWDTLSPGERKRWQVGAALHAEADVVLLDEPTNHLDLQGQMLLLEALRHFRGVGVIVSHDRAMLDRLTSRTVRLRDRGAQLLELPFTLASAEWQRLDDEARAAVLSRRETLEKARRRADTDRRRLESASRQRHTSARMKDRYDSDARTLAADGRAENAERAHAARLRQTSQRVEVLGEQLASLRATFDDPRALFLRAERCPKPVLAVLEGPLHAGPKRLLESTSIQLRRETRALLRGPNGAGKSTLLAALVAHTTLPPERVLVLPQELTQAETQADLELLEDLDPMLRGRVLQLVDALGVDPEALLATDAPSPGEARKLRLALGLMRDAWLAVLDEPTNHLDLPSIEKVERALLAYPGALLVVTHDERLANVLAEQLETWRLHAGQLLR